MSTSDNARECQPRFITVLIAEYQHMIERIGLDLDKRYLTVRP
jgi:hypothetical protein